MVKFKRLDIVLVNLDPTLGSEIKKTRPCVILSPNLINDHSRTLLIAAITHFDEDKAISPLFVQVPADGSTGLSKKSLVTLMQLRTIDKTRILKKLGIFPKQNEANLEYAIRLGTGLESVE